MTDKDTILLDRYVRANDAAAFEQLSRRYRDMVFSTARRVTGNHHDAEDVAQNCFLDLARRAAQVTTSVASYLHTAATRGALSITRGENRRRRRERQAAEDRAQITEAASAERSWDDIAPEVDTAIEQLPERERVPILLYYLRGLTEAEIARELNVSQRVVESRLQVGIRRLRNLLARDGGVVPAGMLTAGLRLGASVRAPASLRASIGRMALAGLATSAPLIPVKRMRPNWRWGLPAGAAAVLAGVTLSAGVGVAFWWLRQSSVGAPYDRLSASYGQALLGGVAPSPSSDPLKADAFAWHIAAMPEEIGAFWRGSQPLFFAWAKQHCGDWIDDGRDRVLCFASPLPQDAERLVAGEMESDDSALLPMRLELLQGLIAARLAVPTSNDDSFSGSDVAGALCQAYRDTLLAGGPLPSRGNADSSTSQADLRRYVDETTGQFRPFPRGRRQRIVEALRPSDLPPSQIQQMIRTAALAVPKFGQSLGGVGGVQGVRVLAVCRRVHLKAVSTQGQAEYLALLASAAGGTTRMLVELKSQLPSSAELAGVTQLDARPPARRAAEDAATFAVDYPAALPVGWCEVASGHSRSARCARRRRWVK